MSRFIVSSAVASSLMLATALAFAQSAPPGDRIDNREAKQQSRIANGAANGKLTPHETQKLERGQAKVNNAEAKAAADGKLSQKERARIEEKQDAQSQRIAKKKHDTDKVKP
jgi:hypothetical protein